MKAEKADDKVIRDLLVKVNKVFPTDLYIIHNRLVYAGPKSEEDISGNYLCILEEKFENSLSSQLKPDKTYYIDNIKEAKDDFENHIKMVDNLREVEYIAHKVRALRGLISDITEWTSFKDIVDENNQADFLKLFTDNDTIELCDIKNNTPSVTIGKSLLPLVTEKNYENLFYNIFKSEKGNLYIITFNFHFTHFQLYMMYYFIPESEEK